MIFGAATAWGTEVYIPGLKGRTGESVNVPIMIDRVDNLAGLKIIMKYDPKILTFKKGVKTKHSDSLMHIINDKKPGRLIVVMAGAKGIGGKDFPILNLTFDIKVGLQGNHTTTVEISNLEMMSDQLKNIECDIKVNPLIISPQPGEAGMKQLRTKHENTKEDKSK
jgi:hypothetical protein